MCKTIARQSRDEVRSNIALVCWHAGAFMRARSPDLAAKSNREPQAQ